MSPTSPKPLMETTELLKMIRAEFIVLALIVLASTLVHMFLRRYFSVELRVLLRSLRIDDLVALIKEACPSAPPALPPVTDRLRRIYGALLTIRKTRWIAITALLAAILATIFVHSASASVSGNTSLEQITRAVHGIAVDLERILVIMGVIYFVYMLPSMVELYVEWQTIRTIKSIAREHGGEEALAVLVAVYASRISELCWRARGKKNRR